MFKINRSLNILDFSDFTFPKFVMHNKIINKTGSKKYPGNSRHCFWHDYLRKLSREISQEKMNLWRVRTFRPSNVYYILKQIR